MKIYWRSDFSRTGLRCDFSSVALNFLEEMGDQGERKWKLRSVDQVEISIQPRYLECVNIFLYLYRKSLLCNKRLHSLRINNLLNVLCSRATTPLLILTEKYVRLLHTELTVSTSRIRREW
jgi:hypothetical protein